jgi:hypothetical protein
LKVLKKYVLYVLTGFIQALHKGVEFSLCKKYQAAAEAKNNLIFRYFASQDIKK